MIKQMNKKQLLIGGVAAAVLVLGGGYAMVASSGRPRISLSTATLAAA